MDNAFFVDDDGFVRAPAARCYEVLSDVRRWPSFWPSTRVLDGGTDRFTVLAGRRPRRLHLHAVTGSWRTDLGFTMALSGGLSGSWEIWLEPGWGGTVVHHLLTADGSAPWQLGSFRRWVRRGTWGLKDLLESEALAADAAASGARGEAVTDTTTVGDTVEHDAGATP